MPDVPVDYELERLISAIWASRTERALLWLVGVAYRVQEEGPVAWVGDRLDDVRCWMQAAVKERARG